MKSLILAVQPGETAGINGCRWGRLLPRHPFDLGRSACRSGFTKHDRIAVHLEIAFKAIPERTELVLTRDSHTASIGATKQGRTNSPLSDASAAKAIGMKSDCLLHRSERWWMHRSRRRLGRHATSEDQRSALTADPCSTAFFSSTRGQNESPVTWKPGPRCRAQQLQAHSTLVLRRCPMRERAR